MRNYEEFQGIYERNDIARRVLCRFDTGESDSSTSSRFSRQGTTTQQKTYNLPADLAALIKQSFLTTGVPQATGEAETDFLTGLFSRDQQAVPGKSMLELIQGIDPASFTGGSAVTNMLARNPYSTDYESGVGDLYERMFDVARARAISGPQNVRGAQDRMGLELGEIDAQVGMNQFRDVRQQQDKEAGVVQQAVQIHNAIETMRRGSQMQAQGQQQGAESQRTGQAIAGSNALQGRQAANSANLSMASEFLGAPTATQTENLRGRGNQSTGSQSWGAGITCCFILLESLNGKLPLYVRKGRDEFVTEARRDGYVHLARWLVPLMCRSKWMLRLVNLIMVRPFLAHGKRHYGGRRGSVGWWGTLPVCWMWISLWQVVGKVKPLNT